MIWRAERGTPGQDESGAGKRRGSRRTRTLHRSATQRYDSPYLLLLGSAGFSCRARAKNGRSRKNWASLALSARVCCWQGERAGACQSTGSQRPHRGAEGTDLEREPHVGRLDLGRGLDGGLVRGVRRRRCEQGRPAAQEVRDRLLEGRAGERARDGRRQHAMRGEEAGRAQAHIFLDSRLTSAYDGGVTHMTWSRTL